jgi:hypothetical protein
MDVSEQLTSLPEMKKSPWAHSGRSISEHHRLSKLAAT